MMGALGEYLLAALAFPAAVAFLVRSFRDYER